MNRLLLYLLLAGIAVILQTTLLPEVVPGHYKPDLILILVIYMGLYETPWRGGGMVYLLGWMFDAVAGSFPGLHGFVLLSIFLAVRGIVTRVNTESSLLLLVLVACGTLLQLLLTSFALEFFTGVEEFWTLMFWRIPVQMLLNVGAAFLLLRVILWLQRTFVPRRQLPGLRKLDNRYES